MIEQESGWKSCLLETLTSLIKDGSHSTHQDVAEGVPLLSAKDVRDGSLELPDNCRRISLADYRSIHKGYQIKKDDILLTIVGSIGRCYLVSGCEPRFTVQRSVAVIRADKAEANYLFHYFRSEKFQATLQELTNASAQGGVYLNSLAKACVTFPISKFEQAKIAEILSALDKAIEQTEALIAKQQRVKTGLMQDLLTRGIDEHGNLRSEDTHKFKDSQMGRIPIEWQASTLGKLAKFLSGYAFKYQDLTDYGWRVVRISNLHKPTFPFWHYDGPVKDSWIIRSGDILFTWAGVASSIDCVRYDGPDALMNQHIYHFDFATEDLKMFVFYFLQNHLPKLRSEIEGGAGQLHLTKAKIQSIAIPQMDRDEMKRVVQVISKSEERIASYCQQRAITKALRAGLMQDLLTGKKRVTPLLEMKGTN